MSAAQLQADAAAARSDEPCCKVAHRRWRRPFQTHRGMWSHYRRRGQTARLLWHASLCCIHCNDKHHKVPRDCRPLTNWHFSQTSKHLIWLGPKSSCKNILQDFSAHVTRGKGKGKCGFVVPCHEHTSKALRYGTHSQGISQFYPHTPRTSAIGMNDTCLHLPSRSWYSLTDPGGMEG